MMNEVPFNKPEIVGREMYYIAQAIMNGHSSGNGTFSRRAEIALEENLENLVDVQLTTSCTSALETSALLLNIAPGDEIILPSYTFVSTANAFALRGAKLSFVDVDADTMNISLDAVAKAITPKTKAIVPVNYAGISCDMDALLDIAQAHYIAVCEDAAQSIGSKYKGRPLGTFGDLASFSFHETKNIICGEGGALAIRNENYIERAEIIREKGTDRSKFFRGEIDKYSWVDLGSSYILSDILSAFLLAQLEQIEEITEHRRALFYRYKENLDHLADIAEFDLGVSIVPEYNECNGHIFYITLHDTPQRQRLIAYLKERDVMSVFHYVPLHKSPYGKTHSVGEQSLPVTEQKAGQLLRLPLYPSLQMDQVDTICNHVADFFEAEKKAL